MFMLTVFIEIICFSGINHFNCNLFPSPELTGVFYGEVLKQKIDDLHPFFNPDDRFDAYIAPFSRDNLWKKYNLVVKANITQYVTIEA